MKRSHDAASRPSRPSPGGSGLAAPPEGTTAVKKRPKKDDPLQSEENQFVYRTLVLSLHHEFDGDDAEPDGIESCVDLHVSKCEGQPFFGSRPKRVGGKKPGPEAHLESVAVYYRLEKNEIRDCMRTSSRAKKEDYDTRVMGLRCLFKDGGETASNNYPMDNMYHKEVIRLEESETIDSVVALWRYHRPGYRTLPLLVGIEFVTARRILSLEPTHIRAYHGTVHSQYHHVPKGSRLHAIKILPVKYDQPADDHRFFQLEMCRDGSNGVSTLASLAHDREVRRLQVASKAMEVRGRAMVDAARDKMRGEVDEIVRSTRAELQSSKEAAKVRRLQAELLAAQGRLQNKASALQNEMETKIAKAKGVEQSEKGRAKMEWRAGRDISMREHRAFLETADRMEAGKRSEDDILCHTPTCRRMYKVANLHVHQLCLTDRCRSWEVNCGCEVSKCEHCSNFLCNYHLPDHVRQCKEKEEEKLRSSDRIHGLPERWENLEEYREPRLSLNARAISAEEYQKQRRRTNW